jgi:hypothetical protein
LGNDLYAEEGEISNERMKHVFAKITGAREGILYYLKLG